MSSTADPLKDWADPTLRVRDVRAARALDEIGGSFGAASSPYIDSTSKRLIDVVTAAALLLVLLPLMILIALLIKATSPGPVLFRQKRHGAGMRPFHILKFRSMSVMECGSSVAQAQRNDPRVTPLGRILRRTSLDELPQIINVLRGEMSLVGPRPHAIAHDEEYSRCVDRYNDRFAARPGLTGLAQVSGARGATPLTGDMQRRIDFDLQYISKASILLDLTILAKTVREVAASAEAF